MARQEYLELIESCFGAQAVEEGNVLFTVPLRLALKDREGPSLDKGLNTTWYARLAMRILQERRDPASLWKPYVQVLLCIPRSVLL